jgi:hypothetical protein
VSNTTVKGIGHAEKFKRIGRKPAKGKEALEQGSTLERNVTTPTH